MAPESAKIFPNKGETYDVIFEAEDRSPFAAYTKVSKKDGIYLNVMTPLPSIRMLWTKMTISKKLMLGENPSESAEDLRFLKELEEAGKIGPTIR